MKLGLKNRIRRLPKVKITIPFCLLILTLYLLDFRNALIPTLLAVSIHESAHILAIHMLGGRIDAIELKAAGIAVNVPELQYISYLKETIIAAAGPAAGILAAAVASVTAKVFGFSFLNYFIGINLVITAINLLPVFPLDGGRIILSLGLRFLSIRAAYAISYAFSLVSIGVLAGICIYLAAFGRLNPSLVVFSGYVALCGIRSRPTP